MAGIKIIGLGKSRGDKRVTNEDLEKFVDTSDSWIQEKTGIRSRYFAEKKSNADMAYEAALGAIENSGVSKENIDYLILATFTPDDHTPATACSVAGKLGLKEEIMALDVNGACAGFIFGCNIANGLLSVDKERESYALVVGSEKISPFLNMKERETCVLFGDGAGAAIVKYDEKSKFAFYGGCSAEREVLYCHGEQGRIFMKGQEVYRFAVGKVPEAIKKNMAVAGITENQVDFYVCHQANERIIDNAAKRISGEGKKFYKNLYEYGNTSAASIPIALTEMQEQGLLKENMKIICTGFGAGLTYGSMYIEVENEN